MAKGKKTFKIPKRIGGVKIPKSVRKGDLSAFLGSKAGQAMLGQAVLLATAAVAGRESHEQSGVRQGLKRPARKLGQAMPEPADRLRYAFGEAIRAFREALEFGGPQQPWPEDLADEAASKKKPSATAEASDARH